MDQTDIIGKLGELSSRIDEKEGLANKYKEIVKSKLAVISDKIRKLLNSQKQTIITIKEDTKKELLELEKKLSDVNEKTKKDGEDAQRALEASNAELSKNLDASERDAARLKDELNKTTPDVDRMRELILKLEEQIKDSSAKQDEYELNMRQLNNRLADKDETILKLRENLGDAMALIVELVNKINNMSITENDIKQITKELDDVIKVLDQNESGSSNDDGGLGLRDVIEVATQAVSGEAKEVKKEAEKVEQDLVQELTPDEKKVAEAKEQPWWIELTEEEKIQYALPQNRSRRRDMETDAKKRMKKEIVSLSEVEPQAPVESIEDIMTLKEDEETMQPPSKLSRSDRQRIQGELNEERRNKLDKDRRERNVAEMQKMGATSKGITFKDRKGNVQKPMGKTNLGGRKTRKKGNKKAKTYKKNKKGGYINRKTTSHKNKKHKKKKKGNKSSKSSSSSSGKSKSTSS
tara:strand:- start:3005 stop:4399 length:1395 start_codon:yes stop_codon:yes gene_type:complete